jgi:hypothetical protein
MRNDLRNYPYGRYLCADCIVFFDRRYRPIIRINRRGEVSVCDSLQWIEFAGQTWMYSDRNPPRHDKETRRKLEKLMADIPLLGAEVARRNKAERRMRTLPPRRWSDEPATQVGVTGPYSSVRKSTPTCTLTFLT